MMVNDMLQVNPGWPVGDVSGLLRPTLLALVNLPEVKACPGDYEKTYECCVHC